MSIKKNIIMINCPYCNHESRSCFKFLTRIYHRCLNCDLIYNSRPSSHQEIISKYRHSYFDENSAELIERSRNQLYAHGLDLIQKRKEAGTILDVGTGCGFFLVEALKRGWQTKGIDPSKKSIEIAKKTNHLDVFNGTLREYDEKGLFDVITFINALDHSPEPWKEIEWAKQRLSAGGLIYIRFPSGDLHTKIFNLFTYLGLSKRIQNYVVFHEFVLTKRFLARLLSDQGFAEISFYSSPCAGGESCNFASNKLVNFCCKVLLYLLALVKKIPGIKTILFSTSLDVIGAKY